MDKECGKGVSRKLDVAGYGHFLNREGGLMNRFYDRKGKTKFRKIHYLADL